MSYRTTIKLGKTERDRLKTWKDKAGHRNYNSAITSLCAIADRQGAIPFADKIAVLKDSRPCVITGQPGSGKTTFARSVIESSDYPSFTLDVHDEYSGRQLDLGAFFSLDWNISKFNSEETNRLRFVPHVNVEVSKAEADSIFRHLNMIKSSLKNWIVIIEEGHRFSDNPSLKALLIESRKFVRKLVIVSTPWQPWQGLAQIIRPPPYTEGSKK